MMRSIRHPIRLGQDEADANASFFDTEVSRLLWTELNGLLTDLHSSTITKCTFDIKDVRVITSSMDRTCKFWDMKSGVNTITLSAHDSVMSDLAMTENGQLLATCGWDKLIYLWDITTGSYRSYGPTGLDKLHEGCISTISFSKDGELLTPSTVPMLISTAAPSMDSWGFLPEWTIPNEVPLYASIHF